MKSETQTELALPSCARSADAPAYLLGEGDAAWRSEFERHARDCAACAGCLAAHQRVLDGLRSEPEARPSVGFDARVMARIRHEAAAAGGPARIVLWVPRMARAAAAILLLGGAVWGIFVLRADRGPDAPVAAADPASAADASRWLIAAQRPDGGWTAAAENFEVGVSAAAILALIRSNDALSAGDREIAIRRGMAFLLAAQDETGFFGVEFSAATYNHGLATLAALEASARSDQPAWTTAADRAVRRLAAMQDASGGWGYVRARPGDANTSASIWPILALIQADDRGFAGLRPAIDRGLEWLLSTVDPAGFMGYQHAGDISDAGDTTTAAGIVCLVRGGRTEADPVVRAMVDLLRARKVTRGPAPDAYRVYFLAEAFALAHDPALQEARAALRRDLAELGPSSDAGDERWPSSDRWSNVGGPAYAAAFASLATRADGERASAGPRDGG